MQLLDQKIHYQFKDASLLQLALCHKSYANEGRKKGQTREDFVALHNERLEFLGDSVLGLVITDLLSERFPSADEGRLSKIRSSLVKENTLANIARSFDLGSHLLLGKGEENSQGREKDSILSSAYEALLGAIYLDGGLDPVFETVEKHFSALIEDSSFIDASHDTKTVLQEVCQEKFRSSPVYRLVSESGPDHEKEFEVVVSAAGLERYGKGRNKKEAEQVAAKYLLESLKAQEAQQ